MIARRENGQILPGQPPMNPSGRPKGSRNRNEIRDILEKHDINLIEEFIENLRNYPHNPIAQNAHILKLMEYVYPKCKETEGGIAATEAWEIVKNDLRERGIVLPFRDATSTSDNREPLPPVESTKP